jgi:putative transcriptional regulator
MAGPVDGNRPELFRSKRDATGYRILVEVAERQPAVSQQEIADAVGVTSQAVSNHLQALVEEGYVEKQGRGRYEVTKEGVDWLISRTDELRAFVQHVSEEVVERVEVTSALATDDVEEGQRVSMTMRDGFEHATPGETGDATAVAVTDAAAGQDVGVTDFEGVVDYDLGTVTIVSVPTVRNGGSDRIDTDAVADHAVDHDLVAVAGVEAVAAARTAGLSPNVRFGTAEAVREAATKGLDVFLLVVADRLSAHTDTLRDGNITYEVLDATTE